MRLKNEKTYCVRCRFRMDLCICKIANQLAPSLGLPLRLILVMHAKESRQASNTGHLTRLLLPNVDLRLHGLPHKSVSFSDLGQKEEVALCLFPSRGGELLTPELAKSFMSDSKRICLVVPDGTWGQTTRMLKRIPTLSSIARIELPPYNTSPQRLELRQRQNIKPERVSTFEAIAAACGIFFGKEKEETMLKLYDLAAFQMMAMRGKFSWNEGHSLLRDTLASNTNKLRPDHSNSIGFFPNI